MKRYIIAMMALLAVPAIAAEIDSLDAVDASNTDRFPENMSPAAVNDGARALEGIVARWSGDESCVIASAGSSSVWTLSATRTLSSYYDGLKMCFDAHTDNDGTVTLNVDSLGAVTIKKENDADLAAGDIEAGMKVEVVYDGTNFQLLSPTVNTSSPADIITTRGDLIYGDSSADAARLPVGGSDLFLGSDGTDVAWEALPVASTTISGVQENATAAEMEAQTALRTVTADQVVRSPYAAKAFVRFAVSGSAIGTVTGQNVASVTYDSTGDFTVEWDVNFTNAQYTCTITLQDANFNVARVSGITAGQLQIKTVNAGGTDTNPDAVNVICFGDR
jgi:hypothetical protein